MQNVLVQNTSIAHLRSAPIFPFLLTFLHLFFIRTHFSLPFFGAARRWQNKTEQDYRVPLLLLYKTDTKKIWTLLPTPLLPSLSLISATIPHRRRTQTLPPRWCQAPLTTPPSVMMEVLITTSRVTADTVVPGRVHRFSLALPR